MADLPHEATKILAIGLKIAHDPLLAQQVRVRMRQELFDHGIVTPEAFEKEVRDKSTGLQPGQDASTRRSGALPAWNQRRHIVRDHLTDFYFACHLSFDLFEAILNQVLAEQVLRSDELYFNPELASLERVLKQARYYESLPPEHRSQVSYHLEEIIVVLIRKLISSHLGYVQVAKAWFSADDMEFVLNRRIGEGLIGGKAAGMLLAWKILQKAAPEIAAQVTIPESYFIGTDVFYDFLSLNGLKFLNQKYKSSDEIRANYPQIEAAYAQGRLPDEVSDQLRLILEQAGRTPLIVRSSSLLEDNFGTSFAGKYDSYFCPNQGVLEENLRALTAAICRIYASVFNPDALLYRRRMGSLDYDERMGILLQKVVGQAYGRYYFPSMAGVAFGRVPIVWHPRLHREDGFVRLVLGLGTRAVDRVADDYARMITLSHPELRPETSPAAIRRYSQHFVDVIDLEDNTPKTLPLAQVIGSGYPDLRWVASIEEDGTLLPVVSLGRIMPDSLVLTFDALLRRADFVPVVKKALSTLGRHYDFPVDMEFALSLCQDRTQVQLHLLQCRPQSSMKGGAVRPVPTDLPTEDTLFRATRMAPQGEVCDIEYIIYVLPEPYSQLESAPARKEVASLIGQLNKRLEGRRFVMLGPGRWGSANPDLGVPVGYADIYNARALVEISVPQHGILPEPSYGTHFFQDLVEAEIYPLAVYLGDADDFLNQAWLEQSANDLTNGWPEAAKYAAGVKLIHIPTQCPGRRLEIVMDGTQGLAFFAPAG